LFERKGDRRITDELVHIRDHAADDTSALVSWFHQSVP
jgi:hypothetical protein